MAESDLTSDLDRAAAEYASGTSPFAELQSYLLDQPVFDRDPRTQASGLPTLRSLDRPEYEQERLQQQYADLLTAQREAEEAQRQERQTAISDLRELLRQETSTAAEAEAAERSRVVSALEDRLAGVKENIAQESSALREEGLQERADIRAQQEALVTTLQQNIDQAKADLEASQERVSQAQTEALGSLEDRQASLVGDLTDRIGGLNEDLGDIRTEVQADLEAQEALLTDQQKSAAESFQARLDSLGNELNSVSDSVQQETAEQSSVLRNEREQLISGLENQIGALKEDVGNLPIEDLQSRINEISEQSAQFADTAIGERAELARQIGLLEEQGITQEDLQAALEGRASLTDIENLQAALEGRASLTDIENLQAALEGRAAASDLESLRGDYQATGRLVEEALQTGQRQREGLQERVQALQAAQLDPAQIEQQRQAAITGAIDPIAAQIEQLRGEIPQQIDVEALRKQITDEIMGQMPTIPAVDPNVSAGVGAGGVPYTGGSTGVNISDGMADQMGLIPGGSVQDQIDFSDNYQGRGGTRTIAPVGGPVSVPSASSAAPQLQANQSLLDQFNTSQAASDFGLSATFDPVTGQYVTDLGGFGFTGDQRYKRQTPDEFAAQFAGGVKPAQETKIAAPPAVTGGIATVNPGATQAAQAAVASANRVPPATVGSTALPRRFTPAVGLAQYGRRR